MKKRVLVVGGGPSALTMAWHLTTHPECAGRYEITVLQMGWRLGGKGASGRDRADHDRILEHGLHIMFGFYDNFFHMITRAYDALGRAPDAPLATWQQAFVPHDVGTVMDCYEGEWAPISIAFPRNGAVPGEGGVLNDSAVAFGALVGGAVQVAFGWAGLERLDELLHGDASEGGLLPPDPRAGSSDALVRWTLRRLAAVLAAAGDLTEAIEARGGMIRVLVAGGVHRLDLVEARHVRAQRTPARGRRVDERVVVRGVPHLQLDLPFDHHRVDVVALGHEVPHPVEVHELHAAGLQRRDDRPDHRVADLPTHLVGHIADVTKGDLHEAAQRRARRDVRPVGVAVAERGHRRVPEGDGGAVDHGLGAPLEQQPLAQVTRVQRVDELRAHRVVLRHARERGQGEVEQDPGAGELQAVVEERTQERVHGGAHRLEEERERVAHGLGDQAGAFREKELRLGAERAGAELDGFDLRTEADAPERPELRARLHDVLLELVAGDERDEAPHRHAEHVDHAHRRLMRADVPLPRREGDLPVRPLALPQLLHHDQRARDDVLFEGAPTGVAVRDQLLAAGAEDVERFGVTTKQEVRPVLIDPILGRDAPARAQAARAPSDLVHRDLVRALERGVGELEGRGEAGGSRAEDRDACGGHWRSVRRGNNRAATVARARRYPSSAIAAARSSASRSSRAASSSGRRSSSARASGSPAHAARRACSTASSPRPPSASARA